MTQAPNVPAVDSRAGRWLQFDWGEGPRIAASDLAVLRVAVVVAVSGRDPGLGLHVGHAGGLPGHHVQADRRGADLRVDGQREDGDRRAHRRDPGAPSADGRRGPALRLPGGQLRALRPESKGGAEATVRIAKADLVPTNANLLPAYDSFAELVDACLTCCDAVNSHRHRATGRIPANRLDIERTTPHVLPIEPLALGEERLVGSNRTISFDFICSWPAIARLRQYSDAWSDMASTISG
ncbi:hypothetical protein ACFYO2_45990 [Streptomyces sp. NPDC006602]|uniref:hypothetical protein n=1 Tax=Streptomyces sp. NPDC006602 TaxID=3364751 RepID=UPI00369152CC